MQTVTSAETGGTEKADFQVPQYVQDSHVARDRDDGIT